MKRINLLLLTVILILCSSFAFADDTLNNFLWASGQDAEVSDYNIYGGVTGTAGVDGGAFGFDGVGDYLDISDNLVVNGDLRIEFEFKSNDLTPENTLIDLRGDIEFNVATIGEQLRVQAYDGTVYNTYTSNLNDNTFYKIRIEFDESLETVSIYVDDVLDGSGTLRTQTATAGSYVGKQFTNAEYFNGVLDELHIYQSLDDSNEVFYANFNPLYDYSDNLNDLSGFNGVSYDATENALDFDGVDDYLTTQAPINTFSEITIGKWIYIDAGVPDNTYSLSNEYSETDDLRMGYDFGGNRLFVSYDDGSQQDTFYPSPTKGTWIHMVTTYDGTNNRLYIDGTLVDTSASGSFDFSGLSSTTFFGRRSSGTNHWDGKMSGIVIYDEAKDETFIQNLYNQGRDYNAYTQQPTAEKRYESAFQAVQDDVVSITLNDTWTTIIAGSTTFDNVLNYGSSSIQTLSFGENTSVSCRTTIDGVPQNDTNSRTNIPNEIGSISLLRPQVNLTGTFDLEVECMKNGGNTFFNYTVGVGHVLDNTTYSIYDTVNTTFTGDDQALYTIPINSTYDGFVVFDWAGTISSPNAQTPQFQMNSSDGESCQIIPRGLAGGDQGSIGDSCSFPVFTGVEKNFTFYGSGVNLSADLKGHVKILSQSNSTGISNINLTSTPTSVASVTINNTDRLAKIYMKAGIPLHDDGQQINFQFYVDGSPVGEVVPYTATTLIKESIQQFLSDAPDVDYFDVELYAWKEVAGGNEVSISGGNLIGYITNDYPLNLTSFTVTAVNDWNGSSINEFSVVADGVTYETTDGSLDVFTQEELVNITFSATNYLDRTYLNHNASNNIEGSIYQTVSTFYLTTKYGEQSVQDFTLITDQGSFNTNTGTLVLNPNLGSYVWDLTATGYYGINDLNINIDSSSYSQTIENITDAGATFRDATDLSPLDAANITLTYPTGATYSLVTDSNGYVQFDGYRQGSNSVYNLTLEGYNGYNTPITFSENQTLPPVNETYDIDRTNVGIRIFYRTNQTIFDKEANVIIQGIGNYNVTDGFLDIQDLTITSGTYTVQVFSDGYYTEQKALIYDSQEEINISFYMLEVNSSTSDTITVEVRDATQSLLANSKVSLLEYRESDLSYVQVSECYTDSVGECKFLVEFGTKTYRITASKIINNVELSASTGDEGIVLQGDVVAGESVLFEERRIVLTLSAISQFSYMIDKFLRFDYEENFNNVTYTSKVSASFEMTDGTDVTVCVGYYEVGLASRTELLTNCVTGSSGIVTPDVEVQLNSSKNYEVMIYALNGGAKVNLKTFNYKSEFSFEQLLNNYSAVPAFLTILMIVIIGLALAAGSVPLVGVGMIGLALIQGFVFPDWVVASGSVLLILLGYQLIHFGRKKEDLN